MKLSDLRTSEQLLADELAASPAFRVQWERTACARAVASRLLEHRTRRGWSQRELARALSLDASRVGELERGDADVSRQALADGLSRLKADRAGCERIS